MADIVQPQMGLNFEQVWAALMETNRQIKEVQQETDRLIRELRDNSKENSLQIKKVQQETGQLIRELRDDSKENDKQIKEVQQKTALILQELTVETNKTITKINRELNQAIGKLGNRFGELIEHLVSPNLLEKFNALNYPFSKINTRVKYKDFSTGKILAEVDVLLENGDFVLAVEIKADPSREDVNDHVKRMEILQAYADNRNDKRRYIGAIAGGIVKDDVKNYALKTGFYVIEQSGDTVNITDTPDSWKPQIWGGDQQSVLESSGY
jgi:hypothetical protein